MDEFSQEVRTLIKDVAKFDPEVKKMIKSFKSGEITEKNLMNEYVIHLRKKEIEEEKKQVNNDIQTW